MSGKRRGRDGQTVLAFLDRHGLEHSPDHYGFAYRYLYGEDAVFAAEVARIIDGGVRLKPEQVVRLTAPPARPDDGAAHTPQLDALTARVLDIIGDALNATGGLNRDLVKATASLLGPDAPSVRTVVAAMIERTAKAESSLAVATVQAQRLREELNMVRADASHDRLTGLVNRAAMEEHLTAAMALPDQCSLAFVDIDRFKSINDRYGHGMGDRVLKEVAVTLRETCLPHLVSRWGGEEFVVLFEGAGKTESAAVMDRARMALIAKRIRMRERDEPIGSISFSAGVVSSAGRSPAAVVAAADALLYRAKQTGRNIVLVEP